MHALPPLLRLSPARALFTVAWPMVALAWLQGLNLLVDTWWVGQLGEDALTGVTGAAFAWWIVLQVGDVAGVGVHARVARAEGAGRRDEIAAWAGRGLVVAAALWALLLVAGPRLVPVYLDALGLAPGGAREHGAAYLGAAVVGAGAMYAHQVIGAVFRGLGDTRTALALAAVGLALNALLDPLLMWGAGPIPALGAAGAAWATAASALLVATVGAGVLAARGIAPRWAGPPAALGEVVRIGGPMALHGVGFSLVYVVIGRVVADLDERHVAALGVGHRLESFPYLAAVGLAVATATLVGQHLGADDAAGARRAARTAAQACGGIMAVGALGTMALAEPLYRLFTDDPLVVASGVVYLRLQAAVWVFMGLETVMEGAFTGAGHTAPAMWIGGVLTAARVPLAWGAVHLLGWGAEGVWLVVAASTAAKGAALTAWFFRGTWETRPSGPALSGS